MPRTDSEGRGRMESPAASLGKHCYQKTTFTLSLLLRFPCWGLRGPLCLCIHSQGPLFTPSCGRGVSATASVVFWRKSWKGLAWGCTTSGMRGRHSSTEAGVVCNLPGRGTEQLGCNKIITLRSYSVEIRKNFNDFDRRYQAIVSQSPDFPRQLILQTWDCFA